MTAESRTALQNGTDAEEEKEKDVPLSGFPRSAVRYLQCGRILNACVAYDPRCEELLSKAVKLDPDALSWLELGICLSKKPDIQFAIECVECSLELERTSRALYTLSVLLRAKMMKTVDPAERSALQKHSTQLAVEAVEQDPLSGSAHSCLGNSLFLEFFSTGQSNTDLLKQACDEYRLGLQCGKEYRNADLHLNAGAAFRYEENYVEALNHLRLAVKYDPSDVIGSHGRLASLAQFLKNLVSGIHSAGGLRAKRIAEYKTSLPTVPATVNPFTDLHLVTCFKDLKKGANNRVAVVGKVVSTVPHEDVIPIASIIMDAEGECVAVCVYNCAPSLSFFIGDTVVVADPHVTEVEDLDLPEIPNASFRSLRVPNPSKISRNGNLPKATQLAPSHLKISAL